MSASTALTTFTTTDIDSYDVEGCSPVVCTNFLKGRGKKKKKGTYSTFTHFDAYFGSKEGTLARVFANQEGSLLCFNQRREQFSVFCHPRGHFSARFGSQEGTLANVLAPKSTL